MQTNFAELIKDLSTNLPCIITLKFNIIQCGKQVLVEKIFNNRQLKVLNNKIMDLKTLTPICCINNIVDVVVSY